MQPNNSNNNPAPSTSNPNPNLPEFNFGIDPGEVLENYRLTSRIFVPEYLAYVQPVRELLYGQSRAPASAGQANPGTSSMASSSSTSLATFPSAPVDSTFLDRFNLPFPPGHPRAPASSGAANSGTSSSSVASTSSNRSNSLATFLSAPVDSAFLDRFNLPFPPGHPRAPTSAANPAPTASNPPPISINYTPLLTAVNPPIPTITIIPATPPPPQSPVPQIDNALLRPRRSPKRKNNSPSTEPSTSDPGPSSIKPKRSPKRIKIVHATSLRPPIDPFAPQPNNPVHPPTLESLYPNREVTSPPPSPVEPYHPKFLWNIPGVEKKMREMFPVYPPPEYNPYPMPSETSAFERVEPDIVEVGVVEGRGRANPAEEVLRRRNLRFDLAPEAGIGLTAEYQRVANPLGRNFIPSSQGLLAALLNLLVRAQTPSSSATSQAREELTVSDILRVLHNQNNPAPETTQELMTELEKWRKEKREKRKVITQERIAKALLNENAAYYRTLKEKDYEWNAIPLNRRAHFELLNNFAKLEDQGRRAVLNFLDQQPIFDFNFRRPDTSDENLLYSLDRLNVNQFVDEDVSDLFGRMREWCDRRGIDCEDFVRKILKFDDKDAQFNLENPVKPYNPLYEVRILNWLSLLDFRQDAFLKYFKVKRRGEENPENPENPPDA